MKFLLLLVTILLSANVFATTTLVNDINCGSYDPVTNESVCVMMLSRSNSEIAIIFNEQNFLDRFSKIYPSLIGQNLEIDFNMVSKLTTQEEIAHYQEMNGNYFFMRANNISAIE